MDSLDIDCMEASCGGGWHRSHRSPVNLTRCKMTCVNVSFQRSPAEPSAGPAETTERRRAARPAVHAGARLAPHAALAPGRRSGLAAQAIYVDYIKQCLYILVQTTFIYTSHDLLSRRSF